MGKIDSLKVLLEDEKKYTLQQLLDTIKDNHCSILIKNLLNLLDREMETFNYEDDFSYLLKVFPYISSILKTRENLNVEKWKTKVEQIHPKIRYHLSNRPEGVLTDHPNYQFLKELIARLENLDLYFSYQLDHVYLGDRYSLIEYVIFDLKNIKFVHQIFEQFRHIVNILDEKGNSLFRNVVSRYLEIVETDISFQADLSYYDHVLKEMLACKKFKYLPNEQYAILCEIYDHLSNIDQSKSFHKEKVYWLENLKNRVSSTPRQTMDFEGLQRRYNIGVTFDQFLEQEVKLYQKKFEYFAHYDRRVIDDYIITIDSSRAEELDDALSARKLSNGNYLLGVHISNVTGLLPYHSPLIEEALDRTTAIYLPDQTICMLPPPLSKDTLSLVEGKPRLATSYIFEISPSGKIENYRFLKTIITSSKRSTYTEVDQVLKNGSDDLSFFHLCTTLQEITAILSKTYHFDSVYQTMKTNSINIAGNHIENDTEADKIVRYAMMITNHTIANYFALHQYPLLYRVHHIAEEKNQKLKQLFDNIPVEQRDLKYEKLVSSLLSYYPKAEYQMSGRHDGLNLDHYCHATSPDRRAADITVEESMRRCYFKKPTDQDIYFLEEELPRVAKHINKKRVLIQDFMKDYPSIKR